MLVLEGEVEVDNARILEQVKECALRFHIHCLLVPDDQALVNHFQCVVGVCGKVMSLNNLGVAAISQPTDEFEICQGVCCPGEKCMQIRCCRAEVIAGTNTEDSTEGPYRTDRPLCLECPTSGKADTVRRTCHFAAALLCETLLSKP